MSEIADLKTEMKDHFKVIAENFKSIDDRFISKVRELGILIEDSRKDVITAIQIAQSTLGQESTVQDHSRRIGELEKDVRILKLIQGRKD